MSLIPVVGGRNPLHVTSCPVVTADLAAKAAPERMTAAEGALSEERQATAAEGALS